MTRFRLTTLFALGMLLTGCPAYADSDPSITITNSGSTNMRGYTIQVMPDGSVSYDAGNGANQAMLTPDLTQALFTDVQSAFPFAQFGSAPCAKSVSFGTVTTVSYKTTRSPDISCGGDPASAKIYQDVLNIQTALNIGHSPRRSPASPM